MVATTAGPAGAVVTAAAPLRLRCGRRRCRGGGGVGSVVGGCGGASGWRHQRSGAGWGGPLPTSWSGERLRSRRTGTAWVHDPAAGGNCGRRWGRTMTGGAWIHSIYRWPKVFPPVERRPASLFPVRMYFGILVDFRRVLLVVRSPRSRPRRSLSGLSLPLFSHDSPLAVPGPHDQWSVGAVPTLVLSRPPSCPLCPARDVWELCSPLPSPVPLSFSLSATGVGCFRWPCGVV